MAATQTEGKITALYERLSRDDDIVGDSSSIANQKLTSKPTLHSRASPTASITRTTAIPASILIVPAGIA